MGKLKKFAKGYLKYATLGAVDVDKISKKIKGETPSEEKESEENVDKNIFERSQDTLKIIEKDLEQDETVLSFALGNDIRDASKGASLGSFVVGAAISAALKNEKILVATNKKVIYGSTSSIFEGSSSNDEFFYSSIKGVVSKTGHGGFLEVHLIGIDGEKYIVEVFNDEKLKEQAKKFVKDVHSNLSSGGAPPPPAQVAPPVDDIPTQLKKLSELKDSGIITENEFDEKKKELLAKM